MRDRAAVVRDLHLIHGARGIVLAHPSRPGFQPKQPGPGLPNALILAAAGLTAIGVALVIWALAR